VDMVYDTQAHTFSFDRRKSGIVNFSENFPAVTVSPTFEKNGKVSLRIFVDKSSIEVFGNGGQFVLTNLVFPTEPYSTLSVSSTGGKAKISKLQVYSLQS
ncbi:MAG: GH32 C-terminal domain-containing protein, partial [Muribaculaceae bacterium]|nr:GH32 C-terminal domain-containing protein [Muribaculaceae bacterium]